MNRKLILIPVILALLAGGAYLARRGPGAASKSLVLHGNIDIRQVDLAFTNSGRIAAVLAREGERVEKGQLLARLDTERMRLTLAQAEAQAAAQRATAAKLRAGSRPEEIRQAEAERDAARVAVADAAQIHKRQLDLVARNFVARQQADSAGNALDGARARLKAADEALALARQGPRREDIKAAEAVLASQEAAAAILRHDIGEGELRAPEAGVIENRILEPGDMATSQSPVFTLALVDPIWARVYLPEAALGRVPTGARAAVTTDSHPDKRYQAWVGYVAASAEFTPKAVETTELRASLVYQARVFVCAGASELRQGMPVTVEIDYDQPAGQPPACAAKP
jgi:HlyD family secretion protein